MKSMPRDMRDEVPKVVSIAVGNQMYEKWSSRWSNVTYKWPLFDFIRMFYPEHYQAFHSF